MAQVTPVWRRSSLLLLVGGALLLCLLWLYRGMPQTDLQSADAGGGALVAGRPAFQYAAWPEYRPPPPERSARWHNATCFAGRLQAALAALPDNAALWRRSHSAACRRLLRLFAAIYTVDVRPAEVSLPAPFRQKVLGWLGQSEQLVDEVRHQEILQVINNYDLHNMAFNPIRARRPQPRTDGPTPREQLAKLAAASQGSCDFCSYKTMTAFSAELGHPSSEHSVVVGNTFKLDGWHALVVSRRHSPLDLTLAERDDMLQLAEEWCHRVQRRHADMQYPTMVWDAGLHAGISQVHPHLHVMLSPGRYSGGVERLRRAAGLFADQFAGENYFSTVVEVHRALGLTVRLGTATALARLDPLLDMEVWVLDAAATPAWRRLHALVVQTLERRLGQWCHSTGAALPALAARGGRMPALARIVSRGDCTAVRADVSSLELFAVSSISVDPYDVVRQLRLTVAEHGLAVV